jgi:dTDP-4-dehydrorhamnose 3,5-epimerase
VFLITQLPLSGLQIVEPVVYSDDRGCFVETFRASDFAAHGMTDIFLQDNYSCSRKGVLRGLHFQVAPSVQTKLVRVTSGTIWDVAVDLRRGSLTYGKWFGVELSAQGRQIFYIPSGFAHGFVALENNSEVEYKCSAEYDKRAEMGIRWNDPDIAIHWPIRDVILSEKDASLPLLRDLG